MIWSLQEVSLQMFRILLRSCRGQVGMAKMIWVMAYFSAMRTISWRLPTMGTPSMTLLRLRGLSSMTQQTRALSLLVLWISLMTIWPAPPAPMTMIRREWVPSAGRIW